MIEKVNITDANVVELIREKLPAATEANKGLMQANGFEQGKNILNEEYDSKISAGVYSSIYKTKSTPCAPQEVPVPIMGSPCLYTPGFLRLSITS